MRAWEVRMMLLSYQVTSTNQDNVIITGIIEGSPDNFITLQAGPDFCGKNVHFFNGEETEISLSRVSEGKWCITGFTNRVKFNYCVNLTECKDKSILPRINSTQLDLIWGRSLFIRVVNQQTDYKINFEQSILRSNNFEPNYYYCSNGIDLFLSMFLRGISSSLELSVGNNTLSLVCENINQDLYGYLSVQIPRIVSTTNAFFGKSCFDKLLCLIIRSDRIDNLHQIGSGFSVFQGIVLQLPARTEADNKDTAWLFQHELIHQWLGISCRAGKTGLDWFFEGFTCYLSLKLLWMSGIVNDQYIRKITDINYRLYREAVSKIQNKEQIDAADITHYMNHGGFFLAAAWERHLWINYRLKLDDIMIEFFSIIQNKVVDLPILLQSIASVSPTGCLPGFFDGYLQQNEILPLTNLWSHE